MFHGYKYNNIFLYDYNFAPDMEQIKNDAETIISDTNSLISNEN